jgi:lipoyl(octanoyl) transferase
MSSQTLSSSAVSLAVTLSKRGHEPYQACFDAMRDFTDRRDSATPDQIWLVEHPPVFTLGLGADPANILDAGDISVVQTDRGGEVTYHGPGQAIAYLLYDLRRDGGHGRLLPREFVRRIEQAVIDTLAAYNLQGERHSGAPGIYLVNGAWQGAKIGALGLKIRGNGCTYHGVALNVEMNLEPFSRIHPCGYQGLRTVDMKTLGINATLEETQTLLAQQLIEQLSR